MGLLLLNRLLFAMNFDRLYFAKQISLSQLGVRDCPGLADWSASSPVQQFRALPTGRCAGLAPSNSGSACCTVAEPPFAAAVAALPALSGLIVRLLYDGGHEAAPFFRFRVESGSTFFVDKRCDPDGLVSASLSGHIERGKLLTYVIGAPLALFYGFMAVVAASPLENWSNMSLCGCSVIRSIYVSGDDLVLTIVFFLTAFLMRELTHTLGWTASARQLHPHALLGSIHL
jgi:hypothetical protein